MRTVNEAFEAFRQKLELTDKESKDAQKRHKEVRECIRASFDINNDFLTGSYGRHTKTKPLKDIDIFFVMGASEDHWKKKQPDEILSTFEKALVAKYGKDNVEKGRRCVTVDFERTTETDEETVWSIDAVPAFVNGDHYLIPDRHLGKWIASNPKVHAEQATAKNKQLDGKWVPFVKMLKRWNRTAEKPIKPMFLLEVMAEDLVDPPFNSYRDEVIRFFSAAQSGVDQDWPDPAKLGPLVSDRMDTSQREIAKNALRDAERLCSQARRAEQQGNIGEALQLWRKIFGSYFPIN